MPPKKAAPKGDVQYLAVRCFRNELAAGTGKRGRRLVIDNAGGGVFALQPDGSMAPDAVAKGADGGSIYTVDELTVALSTGKTPLVVFDQALTDYVNANGGQLPAEGLDIEAPDDFVDERPTAVRRRERIAQAPKEVPITVG